MKDWLASDLYAPEQSLTMGIEAVSADSLIVYIKGQQIAYNIPGGLTGKM